MENDGQEINQSAAATPAQAQNVSQTVMPTPSSSEGDLLASVRERALASLTKNLPNLTDIDPEQKFLISMSALRSTDDLSLLELALQAALAIEDKEVQANSLLDLLNEVNYLIDSRKPAPQEPVKEF